eukprot:gene14302-17387_t
MLHAHHLVHQQADKHVLILHHQHPPLFARHRQLKAKETAQVHHRQQAPAQVGHALDPRLDPGHQGTARFVQHFRHLAHGRHVPVFAQAKPDPTPAEQPGFLGRQVGSQQAAAAVDVQQQLEGGLRLGHGNVPSAGQHLVQGGDQGFFVYRLGQVILGALALAPDLVGFLILGGDDDHRDVAGLGIFGQLTGGLEAIEARHHDIHQHRIRLFLTGQRNAIAAVLGLEDGVTVLFEHFGQF